MAASFLFAQKFCRTVKVKMTTANTKHSNVATSKIRHAKVINTMMNTSNLAILNWAGSFSRLSVGRHAVKVASNGRH